MRLVSVQGNPHSWGTPAAAKFFRLSGETSRRREVLSFAPISDLPHGPIVADIGEEVGQDAVMSLSMLPTDARMIKGHAGVTFQRRGRLPPRSCMSYRSGRPAAAGPLFLISDCPLAHHAGQGVEPLERSRQVLVGIANRYARNHGPRIQWYRRGSQ